MAPDRDAPDRPWVMRTYAGHSTATESDKLYRTNIIVFFRDEMSSYAPPRTFGLEVAAKF